jgi:hypothetical protein
MAKNVRHMVSSSTAVAKHLPRNTKNEGSNPTTGTGREKMAKNVGHSLTSGNSLEVECVTQNTKVEGSNLAADTIREKMVKRLGKCQQQ